MGRITVGILGLALLVAPFAGAGTLALDIIENGSNTGTAGTQSLGWQFQVNSAIFVDGLAFWNHTDTQSHDVAIYDNSGTQLITATVVTTDPQAGTGPWRVHSITPFLLNPGTYVIAAETGTDNYTFNPTSMSTDPSITFLQDRFLFGSGTLAFPTQTSGTSGFQGWFGPSFTLTAAATPEPGEIVLIGTGLLGLVAMLRRRK